MRDSPIKGVALVFAVIILLSFLGSAVYAMEAVKQQDLSKEIFIISNQDFTNITVKEAWGFLSDTGNANEMNVWNFCLIP